MKKKGFTLIELLAVIIILAVLALIVTPVISNVIKKSKENTAVVSAENYFRAVETYVVLQEVNDYSVKLENDTTYKVWEDTDYELSFIDRFIPKVKAEGVSNTVFLNDIILTDGKYPTDGYVKIGNRKVEEAVLTINDYSIRCTSHDKCIVEEDLSNTIRVNQVIIDKTTRSKR